MFFVSSVFAENAVDASSLYRNCSICHRPDGAGVPGTFPPLGAQIAEFSRSDMGRDYLIMVPTRGVMGPLEVAGQKINGFMPPQPMSDQDLASLLNYILDSIVKDEDAGTPFTKEEVAASRSRNTGLGAAEVLSLRPYSGDRAEQ
jgi:mono/diheme cytochrome c family protein